MELVAASIIFRVFFLKNIFLLKKNLSVNL